MLRLVISSVRAHVRRFAEHVARGVPRRRPARRHDAARRHPAAPTSTRCSSRRSARPTPSCAAPTRSTPTASSPRTSSTARWPTSSPTIDGVAAVDPQIEGFGQLTGADGEKLGGEGPPTFAGNWIDDPELNPYELVEGRAPATNDEVVINRGAAKDGDLAVGDTRSSPPRSRSTSRSSGSRRSAAKTASVRRRSPRSRWRAPRSTSRVSPAA